MGGDALTSWKHFGTFMVHHLQIFSSHVQLSESIDIERDMKRGGQLTASVSIQSHRQPAPAAARLIFQALRTLFYCMPAALPGTGHARDFPTSQAGVRGFVPERKHGHMQAIFISRI
jgi:hypothetical protein